MTQEEALIEVEELLLGERSIPVQLRLHEGFDREAYERLVKAIRVLIRHYKDQASVPKKLALAFVDVSNYFFYSEQAYPESVVEDLEDAAYELTALASELFGG